VPRDPFLDAIVERYAEPNGQGAAAPDSRDLARPRLTDVGNAQRFVAQHRGRVHYVYDWRTWLLWVGTHWARDPGNGIMQLAKETARHLYHEADTEDSLDARRKAASWAIQSESEKRLRAMMALAQSEPGIAVTPDALNADPWLLNVLNGTLDLRTSTLRPHRREDLITKLVPVAYEPLARCPQWLGFLERIFPGKGALVGFLQRALGYALTGLTTEQVLFILWGTGANGKSTLLTSAVGLLADYAVSTRPETFMVKKGDTIPNDVARLKDARLVIAVEADTGQRLDEGRVKGMTGGDPLTARFMRAEFFDFTPTFKVFLATNHRPEIRGTDHAIWRRIRLIPFTVTIPEAEQDRQLGERLRAEWPGILAWAVAGCRAWSTQGLGTPEEVSDATAAYQADMDVLGEFLDERCVRQADGTIAAGELYEAYLGWCHAAGERKPLSKRTFGLRLLERGFRRVRRADTRRARAWSGLHLRGPTDLDPPDASAAWTHLDADSPVTATERVSWEQTQKPASRRVHPRDASTPEDLPGWVTGAEPDS
jgi:putative DNA primase/helicase